MNLVKVDSNNIYYPPGGILMWIIIFLELITFGIAMVAMVYYSKQEAVVFHNSRLLLNSTYGTVNTLFLLTSGFFMSASVHELKVNNKQKYQRYFLVTMLFGFLFLTLKTIEYYTKINAGFDISYNTFFTFYWLLTLFHVIHVLVGLVILGSIYIGMKKEKSSTTIKDVEAGAAFWHMCDLIWLLLFPIIYLLF